MRQLTFNMRKTAKIKAGGLGLLLIGSIVILVNSFSILNESGIEINLFYSLIFLLIPIVPIIYFSLIPFEHIIEVIDNSRFETYYRVGRIKFNIKDFRDAKDVLLEQDESRFYCLTIVFGKGQKLILERIPTLDIATKRFEELKLIFG